MLPPHQRINRDRDTEGVLHGGGATSGGIAGQQYWVRGGTSRGCEGAWMGMGIWINTEVKRTKRNIVTSLGSSNAVTPVENNET